MGKRVVILGGGESGTGAALLAKAKGYDVFVSDLGTIKDSYRDDLMRSKIEFEEGKHSDQLILNADLIIKSPGIPEKSDMVQKVLAKGIEMIDEIEFGFRHASGKVIAITGTNGKTTTTLLTYHLLKTGGFDVTLAGNVGESFARKVAHGNHNWYVLEVSSFQLDGIVTFHPVIAVLLNITPDHLDRYDNNLEKYTESKFGLVKNMTGDDCFVYYADDDRIANKLRNAALPVGMFPVSLIDKAVALADKDIMQFSIEGESFEIAQVDTTLRGRHNLINTMTSVTAATLAGVKLKDIREGLKTFKNAPHRLEFVATINGVDFINDSKATNVDSVVYALGSYSQPLIWIAGGIDKGNDYELIREEVQSKVKALICLGTDNEKLKNYFTEIVTNIMETQDVRELVRIALNQAKQGDVVLLSPACASFDLFKNYQDRGEQFKRAVLELKKEMEAGAGAGVRS